MHQLFGRALRFCLVTLAGAGLVGCGDDTTTLPTSLSRPMAMVVAGSNHDRLFIANSGEDTLHVGALKSSLTAFDFLRGDAVFFPVRVAVGPNPVDLVATPDGRYVVVLNGSGQSLRLVDADALLEVVVDTVPVVVPAGPSGSMPSSMVAAPVLDAASTALSCVSPCLVRFYVSLMGLGSVGVYEVQENELGPSLELVRIYDVGGAPTNMALSPDGSLLFVGDSAAESVIRLDLLSGLVLDRVPVGDVPGVLAVAADNSALLVARPRLQDVAVLSDIVGSQPAVVNANAIYAPAPTCVDPCDDDSACTGQHAADRAICGTGSGLAAVAGNEYAAVYVGGVPVQLLTIGDDGSGAQSLIVTCNEVTSSYSQFAIVALASGVVEYISLRAEAQAALAPALVSRTACVGPTVEQYTKTKHTEIDAPALSSFLGACPSTPAISRFICTDVGDGAGVVVIPGGPGQGNWKLDWEGVILTQPSGGRIDAYEPAPDSNEAPFAFTDVSRDLEDTDVVAGDKLQILATPREDSECVAAIGSSVSACRLEWTIARVDTEQYPARLILQADGAPLVPQCYLENGSLAYQTRAGNKYVVYRGTARLGRAQAGDTIGPGGTVRADAGALFSLTAALPADVSNNACDLYDATGIAVDEAQKALFSRDNPFGFVVTDNWSIVTTGYDYTSTSLPLAGVLPTDMVLVPMPNGNLTVFVSYAASNSLYGFEPFDLDHLGDTRRARVFR